MEKDVEGKENDIKKCLNCGNILNKEEEFCTKCGIKYGETKKSICPKCKSEVKFGKKFCPKCGAKIDVKMSDKIDYTKNAFLKNKIDKKIFKILIIVIILIAFGFLGNLIVKKVNISVDELISQERYEDAYKKAKKDEDKSKVINALLEKGEFSEAYRISFDTKISFINELAVYSYEISQGLKNPSSFKLQEVYYDESNKAIVFVVGGSNSYGGIVTGYYYYTYSDNKSKYTLYTHISDFDKEKTYSWDTYSEKLEKSLKNLAKEKVATIISNDENKVDNSTVDIINKLFAGNILREVKFPDYIVNNSNKNSDNA